MRNSYTDVFVCEKVLRSLKIHVSIDANNVMSLIFSQKCHVITPEIFFFILYVYIAFNIFCLQTEVSCMSSRVCICECFSALYGGKTQDGLELGQQSCQNMLTVVDCLYYFFFCMFLSQYFYIIIIFLYFIYILSEFHVLCNNKKNNIAHTYKSTQIRTISLSLCVSHLNVV